MTIKTLPKTKSQLPPGSKFPAIFGMVEALLDQFGTLDSSSRMRSPSPSSRVPLRLS